VPARNFFTLGRVGDLAIGVGLGIGTVDAEAEHRRQAGGQVLFYAFQDCGFGSAAGIVAVILQALVILGVGITESRRFLIKLFLNVRSILFRRQAEQSHGSHGKSQVAADIAGFFHQVAGRLVRKILVPGLSLLLFPFCL